MESLLIDIGNSSAKLSYCKGMDLGEVMRYEGDDLCGYLFDSLKERELRGFDKLEFLMISDVKGYGASYFDSLIIYFNKIVYVTGETLTPLKNRYSSKSSLGPDRLAAVVGAEYLFPSRDCIVFDFGTAITIDFISKMGEFLGGNISLGLNTRFRAASHFTGKLPYINNPLEISDIGVNTESALYNGIVLGAIFEVEKYMEKYPGHTYIFTGGDANYFAEKLKSSIFVVYNLVLMGLARIADYHAKQINF